MKTIKVGIAGLGRLGKVHANNIAFKIPNAQLTAACSIMPAELEYAKTELGVTDVYTDFREMLEKLTLTLLPLLPLLPSIAGRLKLLWMQASMYLPTSRWVLTWSSARLQKLL